MTLLDLLNNGVEIKADTITITAFNESWEIVGRLVTHYILKLNNWMTRYSNYEITHILQDGKALYIDVQIKGV